MATAPYVINPDDPTQPTENLTMGAAAAELRGLKQRVLLAREETADLETRALTHEGANPYELDAQLNANGNKITELPTATASTDAVPFSQVLELIQARLGFLSQITWAPGLAIEAMPARQWTVQSGQAYVATSNHIAGATFAADLAAGFWLAVDVVQLIVDLASTASGKGPALVGFKQAGAGAVDRTAAGKLQETRTPADFASMQDFLNASASASAVFIVPPGAYSVTSTLKVPSDSRIHWTRGAVLMAANGLNADVLQNSNTSSGNTGISWTGHCKIDGNYLNQSGGNGCTFDKVTDSDFGILEANNCKGHGILWSECDRNNVQEIRASGNGKTLAAYGAYLYNSSDNDVKRASVSDNCIGIAVEASGAGKKATRNTISNVKASNNRADFSQSGAGVHFEESAGGYAGDNVVIYPDCRNSTGVGINLTDVDNIRIIEPVLRDNGKSGLTALQSLNIQVIGGEAIGNATTEGAGYRAQLRFDDSGLTGCTGTVIGLKASGSEEGVKTFTSGCAMRFVSCDLAGTVAKFNLNGAGDNVVGLDANGYSIDAKKPVMKAGKTTGQASAGVIVCDSELIDTRGMYNTATGVLTIPTAGVYMLSALATDGGGARLVIQLRKNGAVFAEATNVGGAATESSAAISATFIQANAGDTVDFYLAAGSTVGGSEKTYIAAVHVA